MHEVHGPVTYGAVYTALERLQRKKLISSKLGEPLQTRGGKARRYFRIEATGELVLNETKRAFLDIANAIA